MANLDPIRFIQSNQFDSTLLELKKDNFSVFLIKDVCDAHSFFKVVKTCLPLDPPISGSVHWDAFSDSLFGGIYELSSAKIAICWPDAHRMRNREPNNFDLVLECFRDVNRCLQADRNSEGRPLNLKVILFIEVEKE